jgi:hypothetical protein
VGPKSLGVALLTAGFVGMVFTIQVGACGQSRGRSPPDAMACGIVVMLEAQPLARATTT